MKTLEQIQSEMATRKYRFWFSAKQKKVSSEIAEMERRKSSIATVTIDGIEHEYTECMSGKHLDKKSNFDDAVYLGEATMCAVKINGVKQAGSR